MLDPVREKFAQEYHATGNASEALRRANPRSRKWKEASVNVRASQWLSDDKVQLRLGQLQLASSEKHGITIETITTMLKEDRELARSKEQSAAAVSAVMGLAKVHGLIVDKNEHTGANGAPLVPVLNLALSRNKS